MAKYEDWIVALPERRLRLPFLDDLGTIFQGPAGRDLEPLLLQFDSASKFVADDRRKTRLYEHVLQLHKLWPSQGFFNMQRFRKEMSEYLETVYGSWAGKRIVCCTDGHEESCPPDLEETQEDLHDESAYFIENGHNIDFWKDLITQHGRRYLLRALNTAFTGFTSTHIPNDCEWVLVNIDLKEYVYAHTLSTGLKIFEDPKNRYVGHWGLGDAALSLICWTTDPVTTLGGHVDYHGRWAGHRLAIVRKDVRERYADAHDWVDISVGLLCHLKEMTKTVKHDDEVDDDEEDDDEEDDDEEDDDEEGVRRPRTIQGWEPSLKRRASVSEDSPNKKSRTVVAGPAFAVQNRDVLMVV